jgi:hypothetical protein
MRAASGHFDREILYRDRPVDFDQLLGTLLASEHRLRYGGAFFGLGFRLKGWYAPPMPKFDPKAPPMSLRESEFLLKAEADRVNNRDEMKVVWMFFRLLIGIAALFVAAFFAFGDLLGFLFR